MKKINLLAGRLTTLLLTLMLLAIPTSGIAATTTNVGEMQLGVEYNVGIDNKGETLLGVFTAPGTGVLTFDFGFTTKAYFDLFSDDAYKTRIPAYRSSSYPNIVRYNVEAGTTYYVKVANPAYNPSTFTMSMPGYGKAPGILDSLDPTPDYFGDIRVFDLAQYKGLEIRCTKSVYQYPDPESDNLNVTLSFTDRITGSAISTRLEYERLSATIMYCYNLGECLKEYLTAGNILPQDLFTISISNLKDTEGDYFEGFEGGISQSFTYKCGTLPTYVVSEVWPAEFRSYWQPGDEAGIARITYSGPISTDNKLVARITAGDLEGEIGIAFYASTVPVVIDGNTLIIDFTGKKRALSELITMKHGELNGKTLVDLSHMGVQIANICDINGNLVEGTMEANVGSIGTAIPYLELERAGVATDYVPAPGSDIAETEEIEVWITGLNSFNFSGFDITFGEGEDVQTIHIPASEVRVSESAEDGDEAVFTFALPEAVRFAKNVRIAPANYQIVDGNDYQDQLFTNYNVSQSTPEVQFIGIVPTEGSVLPNRQTNFKVSFSAPVNVDKEKATFKAGNAEALPFSSVKPTGDDTVEIDGLQYSSDWTLIIASSYMMPLASNLVITFAAVDEEGRTVSGNASDDNSYFSFTYQTERQVGVENIITDSKWEVYNLLGIKLFTTEKKDELQSLPTGIYIINGEKITIK